MNNEELLKQAQKETNTTNKAEENEIIPDVNSSETSDVEKELESIDIPEIDDELSDKKAADLKLKEEDKDKIFEIESVEILKPNLRDSEGNYIPPQKFNKEKKDSSKGYKTKLKITYKDTEYVSYLPNVKWFQNTMSDGSKKLSPWFATKHSVGFEEDLKNNFICEITKLYFRYCKFVDKKVGKISQKEFVEGLEGTKVKLINSRHDYDGKTTYRIDIAEFVKE